MFSYRRVIEKGEYLGFCEKKGFIYSVSVHEDFSKYKEYAIVAIKDNEIEVLIYHNVERKRDE